MTGFDLQADTGPPEGFATPRVTADALGVSIATLGQWRARGMAGPELVLEGVTKFGPTWFYHVENVREWARTNRGQGNGGRREGAGRKKKGAKGQRGEGAKGSGFSAPLPLGPSAPVRTTLDAANPMEAAALSTMTEAEAKEHARLVRLASGLTNIEAVNLAVLKGEITRTQGQSLCDLMKFNAGHTALQAERGELLPAVEVEEAWAGFIDRLLGAMATFTVTATAAVQSAMGLKPDDGPRVRAALTAEVDRLRERVIEGERLAITAAAKPGTAQAA